MPVRAARVRGERIHGERVLRVDGGVARLQVRHRRELEDVVAAVAEHELRRRRRRAAAQRVLQVIAVAVRIARDVGRGGRDRRQDLRAGSARILVRRELHDRRRVEMELARDVLDGLPGHVGREALHVFQGVRERLAVMVLSSQMRSVERRGIRSQQLEERRLARELRERRGAPADPRGGPRRRRRTGIPTSPCAPAAIRSATSTRRGARAAPAARTPRPGGWGTTSRATSRRCPTPRPAGGRAPRSASCCWARPRCAARASRGRRWRRRSRRRWPRRPARPAASRAASALLATAMRGTAGRCCASHCTHCASDCPCEYTRVT